MCARCDGRTYCVLFDTIVSRISSHFEMHLRVMLEERRAKKIRSRVETEPSSVLVSKTCG